MQHLIRLIINFLVPIFLLGACAKQKLPAGSTAQASVYFIYTNTAIYDGNMDSLNFTFVDKNSSVTADTIWLPVRITGDVSDQDRPIGLAAVASGSTAVAGTHYKLMNYVMPKDSFQTSLGVILIRDPSLQDTSVVLNLALQPTAGFPVLMKDTLMGDGMYYSRSSIRIIITDQLIKPGNWDSYLISFFGSWSKVKFRFMTGVLGVSTFPSSGPNALTWPQLQYYQTVVRNALIDYNATHPPLTDENGNPVTFP